MPRKIEFTVGSTTYGIEYKSRTKSFLYTKRLGMRVIVIDIKEYKEAKELWIKQQLTKGIVVDTSGWGKQLGYM